MKLMLSALAIAAGSLWAQPANVVYHRAGTVAMASTFDGPMAAPIKGAPYSANATTESVQVLADGNRIVNTTTAFVARDSQGRTRNETQIQKLGPATVKGDPLKIVMIHDPVAQVTYTLESNTKIARKVSTAGLSPEGGAKMKAELATRSGMLLQSGVAVRMDHAGLSTGPGPVTVSPAGGVTVADTAPASPSALKKESLGTQVIEGVVADGTRTTETIPAGQMGNEKDIQIVNEVWMAQDLKTVIMSKHSDPRMGDMTFKLTNLQRSEPAPSLFEVPADYTIADTPVHGTFMFKED